MKTALHRAAKAFARFFSEKGFALAVTACVAIITGTAVWTGAGDDTYVAPTPPVGEDRAASLHMQQHLQSAATPTPLPTAAPILYRAPLSGMSVLTPYSLTEMVRSPSTGIWRVHEGVDLQAALGDPVYAMADGIVLSCSADSTDGTVVRIRHADGIVTGYGGLSLVSSVQEGDRVRAGQTIGYVGNSAIDEKHLGPHLHLSAWNGEASIDPMSLIE